MAQTVKKLPAIQETLVQSLGQEDPLEKEMATHTSILAWKIPYTEEPGGLQSPGLHRAGHDLAEHSTSCVKESNGDRDRQQRSIWILLTSHSVCTASASQPKDHASHVCVSASREKLRASSPESDVFHSVIHSFWKVRGHSMVIKQI